MEKKLVIGFDWIIVKYFSRFVAKNSLILHSLLARTTNIALYLFIFPCCSADHERDRPPCKVVFFGLATNNTR